MNPWAATVTSLHNEALNWDQLKESFKENERETARVKVKRYPLYNKLTDHSQEQCGKGKETHAYRGEIFTTWNTNMLKFGMRFVELCAKYKS